MKVKEDQFIPGTGQLLCVSPMIFVLPISGSVLLVAGIVYFIGRWVKNERIGNWLRIMSIWISAPVALLVGAAALRTTSWEPREWQCAYFTSVGAQIFFHIILPLAVVVTVLRLCRRSYSGYSGFEISFWAVAGIWGAALMSYMSVMGYCWKGGQPGFPYRLLHHSTIAAFCIIPAIMPLLWRSFSRVGRAGMMFTSLGLAGFLFGFVLQAL